MSSIPIENDPLHVLATVSSMMNPVPKDEIRRDVAAACDLAALPIDRAWSIDVFCDGIFWEAAVLHKVGEDGFSARFRNSLETIYIHRADFMKTWRFPFNADRCELYMLLVPDDHM